MNNLPNKTSLAYVESMKPDDLDDLVKTLNNVQLERLLGNSSDRIVRAAQKCLLQRAADAEPDCAVHQEDEYNPESPDYSPTSPPTHQVDDNLEATTSELAHTRFHLLFKISRSNLCVYTFSSSCTLYGLDGDEYLAYDEITLDEEEDPKDILACREHGRDCFRPRQRAPELEVIPSTSRATAEFMEVEYHDLSEPMELVPSDVETIRVLDNNENSDRISTIAIQTLATFSSEVQRAYKFGSNYVLVCRRITARFARYLDEKVSHSWAIYDHYNYIVFGHANICHAVSHDPGLRLSRKRSRARSPALDEVNGDKSPSQGYSLALALRDKVRPSTGVRRVTFDRSGKKKSRQKEAPNKGRAALPYRKNLAKRVKTGESHLRRGPLRTTS